ncbi:peptidylprolyl isomerase [Pelagibius sp. Alg239-R121]|uniref:peptidylprolyl isomerase n=1 Tax=Pelagibius sp. Alg239-R121 TaxID=2993448 RepID=UPI0024A62A4E|nr:peptidylprolyl isomerase [Pelagibius sp. Alg239-R121]
MRFLKSFAALLLGVALSISTAQAADPENTLVMELPAGQVLIALRPDLAPNHVTRIKELTRQGFYDGLVFHRVIDGFMAQTGDPTGTGRGGSGQNITAEFTREPFKRGTLGMARSRDPNSADSQFFVVFERASHLDTKYTVWGEVVSGMQFVDRLKKAPRGRQSGTVDNPDAIVTMKVQADVK